MPVYADYNATTPVDARVLEAMKPFFSAEYANPAATHVLASTSKKAVDIARSQVAGLLGAHPAEIIFTSGGTESDNIAVSGALPLIPDESVKARVVLVSAVEHPAILEQIPRLQERGYTVKKIRVHADGGIDMEHYTRLLTEHQVALVSIMWANNETGVIYPIDELATLAHKAGALFHTDAVQAVGRIDTDVVAANIDLLSLSSHKLYGPKGVGALFVRQGLKLHPLTWGGGQENGIRPGTLNVPGIVGLGSACEIAQTEMAENARCVETKRNTIESALINAFPRVKINGSSQPRLPNTLSIALKNIESEMVLIALDREGVCASAGSACSAGDHKASHVLTAMSLPRQWLYGVLRISISHLTSDDEVKRILASIIAVVKRFS